jgi:hypothetical protein
MDELISLWHASLLKHKAYRDSIEAKLARSNDKPIMVRQKKRLVLQYEKSFHGGARAAVPSSDFSCGWFNDAVGHDCLHFCPSFFASQWSVKKNDRYHGPCAEQLDKLQCQYRGLAYSFDFKAATASDYQDIGFRSSGVNDGWVICVLDADRDGQTRPRVAMVQNDRGDAVFAHCVFYDSGVLCAAVTRNGPTYHTQVAEMLQRLFPGGVDSGVVRIIAHYMFPMLCL